MALTVIRRASFKAAPWRNGGGTTHEALRLPADAPDFHFRLSIADIEAAGPFSDFAGYDRTLVLLRGAGVALSFGDGTQESLRRPGDLVRFDGALTVNCELIDGPCVDLNFIVAKAVPNAARIERVHDGLATTVLRHQMLLIMSVDEPLVVRDENVYWELEPWDVAIASDGVVTLQCSPKAGSRAAGAQVFLATVNERP